MYVEKNVSVSKRSISYITVCGKYLVIFYAFDVSIMDAISLQIQVIVLYIMVKRNRRFFGDSLAQLIIARYGTHKRMVNF